MKKKQFLVLLLSFMLIFTMMPVSVFAADVGGESQETAPIQVFADGAKCSVVETEIKGAYTYYSTNSSTTSAIRNGVYKVIVPQDTAKLTFALPEGIQSATDLDFDSQTGENCAKIEGQNQCEITSNRVQSVFSTIPHKAAGVDTDGEESFIDICKMQSGTGITHAYVNFNAQGKEYMASEASDYTAEYGLLIQFGGESQETAPIQVFADGAKCSVVETEIKGAYTYYSTNSSTTSAIRNGVYKVIVPQDTAKLTFALPEGIQSATDLDFDSQTGENCAKIEGQNQCEITSNRVQSVFSTIPHKAAGVDTDGEESFIDICKMQSGTGITHAYVNFNAQGKEYMASEASDYTAEYGLLIQFGGESQEQESVKVSVESVALKDAAKPLRIGEKNTVRATLKNNGTEQASDFTVKLQADGSKVTELTYAGSIDPGEKAEVELAITPQAKGNPNDGKTELKVLVNNQEDT